MLLERWNRGELTPSQLIEGFNIGGDQKRLEMLEQDLLRNQGQIFLSIRDFIRYANIAVKSACRYSTWRMIHLESLEEEELPSLVSEDSRSAKDFIQGQRIEDASSLILPENWGESVPIASLANKLAGADPRVARLLVLRLFGEYTLQEIAAREGLPIKIVRRDWELARSWLESNFDPLDSRDIGSFVRIETVSIELLKSISQHPELLKTVDWRIFEKLLSGLLEKLGYEVELQQGTQDGGIDIFAIRRDDVLGSHRYIIQAKRWSRRVGVVPVRELLFLQGHHKVSKACLATTTFFTRGAWRLADEYRWQLELRDYEGLKDWIRLATSANPT
jgi:HJR/Mrr/RecB family endonuclease